MAYKVHIIDTTTGEGRDHLLPELNWFHEDGTGSEFLWTEGNFGCDCNRALEWIRASGREPTEEEFDATPCGKGRYRVTHAELPDGRRVEIDGPTDRTST